MTARADFLAKYAALTTRRLAHVWKVVPEAKTKRKKDMTSEEILTFISKKTDPVTEFANEIEKLNPTYDGILKSYAERDETGSLEPMASVCRLANYLEGKVGTSYGPTRSFTDPDPPRFPWGTGPLLKPTESEEEADAED